jgi:hypothetical protein
MPLRALEPKSRASANSATFAHRSAGLQDYTNGSPHRFRHATHAPLSRESNTADILFSGPSR